mmetsp:Transcript_38446/g.119983  ORF Transcript_38446/g.119983 Transcript_38446/m.119983 type:complete len:354 (-) Transcript_38446:165-1226(-)
MCHGAMPMLHFLPWCPFPAQCMTVAFLCCALARAVLGRTVHPVEDEAGKARSGEEPTKDEGERLDSFTVLTITGHLMAQATVLLSVCRLPVALNGVEVAHCAAIVAIVQFEMFSTKVLCKAVARLRPPGSPFEVIAGAEWRPFLLWPNIAAWCRSHSPLSFAYYVWGILWYETYVNMLLAGPLEGCGWPLAVSAAAVGLTTGLLNHGLVNGLQNGVMATVFYVTMAVMFSVSHSVLPVTVAHSLFYFRQLHAGVTSVAFGSPLFVAILAANTACMFALLEVVACLLPPAAPLRTPEALSGRWKSLSGGAFAALSLLVDCVRLCVLAARYAREPWPAGAEPEACYRRLDEGRAA